jgi:hypothetical protein
MKSSENGAKTQSTGTSGNREANILTGAEEISLKRET